MDGIDAIEKAKVFRPDLILLDLVMHRHVLATSKHRPTLKSNQRRWLRTENQCFAPASLRQPASLGNVNFLHSFLFWTISSDFGQWVSLGNQLAHCHYLARRFRRIRTSTADEVAPDTNHVPTTRIAQGLYSDGSAPSQTGNQ